LVLPNTRILVKNTNWITISSMKTPQTLLDELEGLFIKEFRTCQTLYTLTQEERKALIGDDVVRLPALTNEKGVMLDRFSMLEESKFELLHQLGVVSDGASKRLQALRLVDFLTIIDEGSARRLLRIQEGILILQTQVRDLARGNRSLAANAVKRTSSLQAHLLNMYWAPQEGAPPSTRIAGVDDWFALTSEREREAALPAIFAAIITARDALTRNDAIALTSAINELQQTLDKIPPIFSDSIDAGQFGGKIYPVKNSKTPVTSSGNQGAEPSLVEAIATLYYQENAYQDSLKLSNRMLAAG